MSSRYVVGIDLGTTNSALGFIDTESVSEGPGEARVSPFAVPQVVAAGSVEERASLPSSMYVAGGSELPEGSLNLPWRFEDKVAVGAFAREQGAKVPARYIHSSKSWLCHGGVDREAPILPPNSPEEDARRSPQDVATAILNHFIDSWNHKMGADADLRQQEVTLCVPASFDPGARNLTVAAAEKAGFENLQLLEEPQAAFYSWIESTGAEWRDDVSVGDLILVVDVGGGTTDFSLIALTEKDGEVELRRVAVGEHILLGGDNMDLAIAYGMAMRLEEEKNKKLDQWQFAALVNHCRAGKEALLADPTLESYPIAILGRGSSVIGGTIKTELPRAGLDELLIEGFFPVCEASERPAKLKRSGFREAGLPYAQDPAITRHLARFLGVQAQSIAEVFPDRAVAEGQPVLPTAVLFNGGVFKAEPLRERVLETLGGWCAAAGQPAPRVLGSADLDLAVARGAAYLGLARRGRGVRIRGGSPRTYYIGIEGPMPAVPGMAPPLKAMCVVPYGMEEGTSEEIAGEQFDLNIWTGEPASFRFLSSTTRRHDGPGEVFDVQGDEFIEHSPIETTLGTEDEEGEGRAVEVNLHSELTEIGVLKLSCRERSGGAEFQLEFNVRHEE